ncbi:uncharacterized protein LOC131033713 isoform X2 [Cryptomeria japonica]|uniref:uncharacterized protein LOC131033713 isoform X2 n=2 Tax=Cryptomeria japonica TaxID=3369 RepID=UPI0025AC242F|nr:uncharacterized protein LOC131033713 isoform X2 [Cryptomeria japonica]
MPQLTFDQLTFDPYEMSFCTSLNPLLISRVENIISNILLLHSRNLEGFHLHNNNTRVNFNRENVCKWVRYASRYNVQHLTLYDHTTFPIDLIEIPPPALFSCSHLITLNLGNYDLTSFPIDFVGFPHLLTCHLQYVQLTDESLVSFISLCPRLQKLEIRRDSELGNVVIFSSTIEHLRLERVKSLSLNCPLLRTLSGVLIEDLSVNGVVLPYELSHGTFHLEMDCGGTLRVLNMDWSPAMRIGHLSPSRFLHIVDNFQSLKKLVIHLSNRWVFRKEAGMDVPLLDLLHRLPNLHTLSMLGFFLQEVARDPIPDCLTPPHVNLKKICVDIHDFDHKEVAVISCLLQSMPSLQTLEIQLPEKLDESEIPDILDESESVYDYEGQCLKLLKDIMYMRRASSLARIIILDY